MMVFVLAFAVFSVALVAMSLGVMLSGRRIRGSCGGLAHMGGKHGKMACDSCPSGGQNCSSAQEPAGSHSHS
jgi:hypothetical protein